MRANYRFPNAGSMSPLVKPTGTYRARRWCHSRQYCWWSRRISCCRTAIAHPPRMFNTMRIYSGTRCRNIVRTRTSNGCRMRVPCANAPKRTPVRRNWTITYLRFTSWSRTGAYGATARTIIIAAWRTARSTTFATRAVKDSRGKLTQSTLRSAACPGTREQPPRASLTGMTARWRQSRVTRIILCRDQRWAWFKTGWKTSMFKGSKASEVSFTANVYSTHPGR